MLTLPNIALIAKIANYYSPLITAVATVALVVVTLIYIREIRKERISGLSLAHTNDLKKKIIKPLIEVFEKSENSRFRLERIKSDPLYEDLGNHIPSELEDPRAIINHIEKREGEFKKLREKLTKELEGILDEIFRERKLKIQKKDGIGWSPSALANAIADSIITYGDYRHLNFKEIFKGIKIWKVVKNEKKLKEFGFGRIIARVEEADKLSKEDVAKVIYEILSDERIKKLLGEANLKDIYDEIYENKRKLLNILRDLEDYEILPGVCKYLKPGVKLERRGRRRSRDKASRIKG